MNKLLAILCTWKPVIGYIIDFHIQYNEEEQRYMIRTKIKRKREVAIIGFYINESTLLQKRNQLRKYIHKIMDETLKECHTVMKEKRVLND